MPKDDVEALPIYRHGTDNSKLISAIRVLAAGKRQLIFRLPSTRRIDLVMDQHN